MYMAICAADNGDAPSSYGLASHYVQTKLRLGATIDAEGGGGKRSGTDSGDGDDDFGPELDDEDGVSFSYPAGGKKIHGEVDVYNNTGVVAYLYGWIDINENGSFEAGEQKLNKTISSNSQTQTVTFSFDAGDIARSTYARFRVCTEADQCDSPTNSVQGYAEVDGHASDGEVEDHLISWDPTAVTIGNVELGSISVPGFLGQIGLEQMDVAALYALLMAWAPDLAASVDANDREAILAALTQFLDSDGDGQVAIIAWQTLEERGTIGFYVERQQDGGTWIMLNDEMLPGLITAPMGGEYKLADPEAVSGVLYQYRVIEQE
ncbi:MAG: hypothetical protein GY697_28860, partial [Desulfobacterales bacterium]|nr:hypothetical protein [Desulfobacterales bacterium]